MPPSVSSWLRPESTPYEARYRLFLFPCAGAGASMYHAWGPLFRSDTAVQSIQLPGRQDRFTERPFSRIEELVEALAEVVAAEDDGRPFAFFGHSLGALLAYRLTVALESAGDPGPVLVAASGWAPEGFRMPVPAEARLADAELVAAMSALGAFPAFSDTGGTVDEQFLALTVPAMRADISVAAGYRDDRAVVDTPVVAFAGADDQLMEPAAMESWTSRTTRYLGARTYPGGHFFLDQEAAAVTADLADLLLRQAR